VGSMPFSVTFDDAGLVPVVAQEENTGAVLLLAWMNAEALARTLAEGVLVFWSRSRQSLWRKGEQSGNTLRLRELRVNCEGNSLLALVELEGAAACHEGYRSCYFRRLDPAPGGALTAQVIAARQFDPEAVYGSRG
jgi:phosphoribosyl-AMP cyclohydrolase